MKRFAVVGVASVSIPALACLYLIFAAASGMPPFRSKYAVTGEGQTAKNQPASRGLTFEATDKDLGVVQKLVVVRFPFRNASEKPVAVSAVSASCSCTTLELKKHVYQPRETGEIAASVDMSRKGPGIHGFSIRADYADPDLPSSYLRIFAGTGRDLEIQPRVQIRQIGHESASATFSLVDYRMKHLHVLSVTADDKRVRVAPVVTPRTYNGGWRWVYRVSVAGGDDKQTPVSSGIRIETDDPSHRWLATSVVVEKLSRLRVLPGVIFLRRAGATTAAPLEARVIIDDRKGLPVRIQGIRCESPSLSASYDRGAALRHIVRFRLAHTNKAEPPTALNVYITVCEPVKEEICVKAMCAP